MTRVLCSAIFAGTILTNAVMAQAETPQGDLNKKKPIASSPSTRTAAPANIDPPGASSATELFKRGFDALAAKKYEDATYLFEAGLIQEPKDPLAYVYLGEAMLGMGRFVDAMQKFEKALAIEPSDPIQKAIAEAKRGWYLSRKMPDRVVNTETKRKYAFNWSDKLSEQLKQDPQLAFPVQRGKKYHAVYREGGEEIDHVIEQLPDGTVRDLFYWWGKGNLSDRKDGKAAAFNIRDTVLAGLIPLYEINDRVKGGDQVPADAAKFLSFDWGVGRLNSTGGVEFHPEGTVMATAPYSYWQFQFVEEPLMIEGNIFPLKQGNSFSVSSGPMKIVECKVGGIKSAKSYSNGFTGQITLLACHFARAVQRYYWGEDGAIDPEERMVYHPDEMVYYLHDAGVFLRYPGVGKKVRDMALISEELVSE